jgi:Uma2 family endonuclease
MISQAAEAARPFKSRKKRLTYEDYVRLTPPNSGNYELHDGQIIFMPSPTPLHQKVAFNLSRKMADFAEAHQLGEVYIAPLDTLFDKFNTFQPDMLFISKERLDIVGQKKIEAAPDLVVEVLSDGNTRKEMLHKKHTFENYGVREYWLIDLKKETLTQYLLKEGEFESRHFSFDEEVSAEVLPGYKVCLRNMVA